MIKIDNINVIVDGSEYSAKVEIPSKVTTSTKQEETVDLAKTPNLFIKVVDPDNTLKIGVNVEAQLTTEEGTYTMICDVVSKNQMYTTLQYAYGMTFEADDSSDDDSSDDPAITIYGDYDNMMSGFKSFEFIDYMPVPEWGAVWDTSVQQNPNFTATFSFNDGNGHDVDVANLSFEITGDVIDAGRVTVTYMVSASSVTFTFTPYYNNDNSQYEYYNGFINIAMSDGTSLGNIAPIYLAGGDNIIEPARYNINEGMISFCTVTIEPNQAAEGETVTVTVTPDQGNMFDSIEAQGSDTMTNITITGLGNNQYSFTMPAEDVDLSVNCVSTGEGDEPTIGDLGFTIDSTNYDHASSSFTDNGNNTWTADLVRTYPHGDFNLPFCDADGNVIFDAANMYNNNQGDPIFDIIIDEPNEYNASATFRTAPSYGSDDQMLGSITAAIGTYKLSGKIRTNVSNATVYLTDAEYNAIVNASNYYTYDGSQYDEENDGVTYKRYTLDLTPWQNAEGNATITLEVFDPNSLGT